MLVRSSLGSSGVETGEVSESPLPKKLEMVNIPLEHDS
jgi:hypothetical protein